MFKVVWPTRISPAHRRYSLLLRTSLLAFAGILLPYEAIVYATDFTWQGHNDTWEDTNNWTGGDHLSNPFPAGAEDTVLSKGNIFPFGLSTPTLTTGPQTIGALSLLSGGGAANGTATIAHVLTVSGTAGGSGTILVGSDTNFFSNLLVFETGSLADIVTEGLTINNNGNVYLQVGAPEIEVADSLSINSGGKLFGEGTVRLFGSMQNSGIIQSLTGNLTISNLGTGSLNLDGNGNGLLETVQGNLTFTGDISADTEFNGTIKIANGFGVEIPDNISLDDSSTVTFNQGGTLDINGTVNIQGTASISTLGVAGTGSFAHTNINISGGTPSFSVVSNTTLDLGTNNTATFSASGASFSGNGQLDPADHNIVDQPTQIGTPGNNNLILDMDSNNAANWTLNNDLSLDLVAIEPLDRTNDGYDATITINDSTLDLDIAHGGAGGSEFLMQGTFNLNDATINNADAPNTGIEFNNTSTINALTGDNCFLLPVDFRDNTITATVSANAKLQFDNTVIYRGGTFAGAGHIEHNHNITVAANTTINVATFDWDGHTNNDATTTIQSGATFTLNATQINDTNNQHNDHIIIQDAATLIVNTPSAWNIGPNGGVLTLQGAATATPDATVGGSADLYITQDAHVTGNGQFDVPVTNSGNIAPGQSAGTLLFNDGFSQTSSGVLEIEIGGETPFSQHDKILVTGEAELAGTLDVSLIDLYAPTLGSSFEILHATDGLDGTTFDQILLPTLSDNLSLFVLYGTNNVSLLVSYSADFNTDGFVNSADLVHWHNNYGNGLHGADYLAWQRHTESTSLLSNASVVPEPTTFLLLLLFATLHASMRR